MTLYATLEDARRAARATTTTDDQLLLSNLRVVSRRVDRIMGRSHPVFAPLRTTMEFPLHPRLINARYDVVSLHEWVCELAGVTFEGQPVSCELWPSSRPTNKLRHLQAGGWMRLCASSRKPPLIEVTGVFGYVRDYGQAWLAVDELTAAVSASQQTLSVVDASGPNPFGLSPRVSVGNLVRIGNEYVEVVAMSGNALTVRRGVNGTSAQAHPAGAAVEVWQVEEPVRDVVARQAAFKYARRGAYESTTVTDLTSVQFPADLLNELRGVLQGYVSV